MTRKPKYPHVIKDLDKIIERLLNEEITMNSVAVEYKTTRSTIQYHVQKNTTPEQYESICKRGHAVAGRKRCGIANNPSGGGKPNSKANQFGKTYADPLSPVRHRIVRPTFEVQTKGADGKWHHLDFPTCEDTAVLLLGRLYCYNLISQADCTEQESV